MLTATQKITLAILPPFSATFQLPLENRKELKCVADSRSLNPFRMGEPVRIAGHMHVSRNPEDVDQVFTAFLMLLNHPKGDVIANSGFLKGSRKGAEIAFDGILPMPQRAGDFELRLCVMDKDTSVQAPDRDRLFYRQPVRVFEPTP